MRARSGRMAAGIAMITLLLVATGVASRGQETSDAPGAPDATDVGLDEPLESVADLERRVLPLRRAELQNEAEAWIGRLQSVAQALSEAEIAADHAGAGVDRQELLESAARLRLRLTAVAGRVKVVVAAYKAKGGDAEEFEKYVSAVSGAPLDVTDTGALWVYLRNWLVSAEGGGRVLRNVVFFALTLLAFWILSRIVQRIVRRALKSVKRTSNLMREFLAGLTKNAIMILGAVVALSVLGVNIGPLVAAIGAAGLVVGFALQGTLSNFASGILILLYRPFDVGDGVTAGGVSGTVESMTLVSTTVLTGDNQRIVIPNNSVWGGVITNATGRPTRRIDLSFNVSYRDDIDRARNVLEQVVSRHPLVLKDPPPVVRVNELANSSISFIVRPWAKTADYWTVYWDVVAEVKRVFDREGISIPSPRMEVQVLDAPGALGAQAK